MRYLCDLGQVICLALLSSERMRIMTKSTTKVCCLLNEIKKVKFLAQNSVHSKSSRTFPCYCYYFFIIKYLLYWGEGRCTPHAPNSENFHFWLNMHLAKSGKPRKFKTQCQAHVSTSLTTWWQFGCGIPKTEKVYVCIHPIHTYFLNQRNEKNRSELTSVKDGKTLLSPLQT